jgi:outer membrane lipoprotein carrier protein
VFPSLLIGQELGAGAIDFPPVLDRFLTEVRSLTADFEQELWTADQRLVEISHGTVAIKRPGQFRWNYTDPLETMIVTDGETLWMYDVEIAQVTRSRLDERESASPAMLLSGDEAVRDGFVVVSTEETEAVTWISLRPKFAGSDFKTVRLGFADSQISRMELIDGLDQTTAIGFSNVMTNVKLDESLFEFRVPPGVNVLGD